MRCTHQIEKVDQKKAGLNWKEKLGRKEWLSDVEAEYNRVVRVSVVK